MSSSEGCGARSPSGFIAPMLVSTSRTTTLPVLSWTRTSPASRRTRSALGVSGAIFQSLMRNPLGSPDVMGFDAGAYTGALLDALPVERGGSGVTAFLTVQEGCDKFCTYCVVPYTRGAEVSRPFAAIVDEAKALVDAGARVTVVPATATAEEILAHAPDGLFLSNGPGDPAATGEYAVPMIQDLLDRDLPIFGICLGHQMLALALGAKTVKMEQGHHGANHPVKDLDNGRVSITSQNHGFAVDAKTLPANLRATHISLFDGTLQGLARTDKPAFCFQGHPEASPGPHDIAYLFDRFTGLMDAQKAGKTAAA